MASTYWRIIDLTEDTIRAESLPDLAFAQETLEFLKRDFPFNQFEIEKYTRSPQKPGFGRDPDLY